MLTMPIFVHKKKKRSYYKLAIVLYFQTYEYTEQGMEKLIIPWINFRLQD